MLEYVNQESNNNYYGISIEEQEDFNKDAKDIYLSYVLIRHSRKQHDKMKTNI